MDVRYVKTIIYSAVITLKKYACDISIINIINIKSSYLDAGISELIIDEFLEFQSDKYTQKKDEGKKTEKQISSLEHKSDAIISDSKKLSNAIETIETHTKLKYEDPDFGRSCYRYEYDQAIKGLIEQKKDKVKI